MKINKYILLLFFAAFFGVQAIAQKSEFYYKRNVAPVTKAGWYGIELPPGIFQHLNKSFSDIRLYAISPTDTAEIPYLLNVNEDQVKDDTVQIPVINKSKQNGIAYLSFEMKGHLVNYLDLQFEQTNYNAFIKIEGSNNQREWFELSDKQRILSIENENVNYASNTIHFPINNYKYLRVSIQSDHELNLSHASFRKQETKPGVINTYSATWKVAHSRKEKKTVIDVKLKDYALINTLHIDASSDVDYYRNFAVEYVSDSSITPKGYTKFYSSLLTGYLTSVYPNNFTFSYQPARELRITIFNNDNAPLAFKNIEVSGPRVELITKLKPEPIFMFYGNASIENPSYDLIHFSEKIPDSLNIVKVGQEEIVMHPKATESSLFKSQWWLWIIMGIVIAILGFFTIRMMKNH